MVSIATKRHFFLIAREFGIQSAIRFFLSGKKVPLSELLQLWGGK